MQYETEGNSRSKHIQPPTPWKKRATSNPAKLCVPPHASKQANQETLVSMMNFILRAKTMNIPTNKTPLAMKMGRRPLISEKGARTMGAKANPTQKRVMLRL